MQTPTLSLPKRHWGRAAMVAIGLMAAAALLFPQGFANAQMSLESRVAKLEQEMRAVQRKVFPGGNERFFDELFAALEQAEEKPVRIVHYGDSQIEDDRLTGTIRERLQERFGGNGPGMMPARKLSTPRMSGSSSVKLRRYFNYGGQGSIHNDNYCFRARAVRRLIIQ